MMEYIIEDYRFSLNYTREELDVLIHYLKTTKQVDIHKVILDLQKVFTNVNEVLISHAGEEEEE